MTQRFDRRSGRFQPLDFRLELKAQLRAFLVGQPIRHLWKDGPIEQDGFRLPWKLLRRTGFGENLVEFGAVNEHQAGGIDPLPILGPLCTAASNVGAVLLGGNQRLFL